MRPFATLPAALALLAAACSDVATISPEPEPSPGGFHTELTCTASVREGQVSCGDDLPEGGSDAFPRLIVGGQNVYVRLKSSDTGYNPSDSIFQFVVRIRNLMTQPFGTPNGTTPTGVRVFFYSGPDVTGGTGSVSVHNEDGNDMFLDAVTPYFRYGGLLRTNGVSDAKTWRFKVDPQVETFNFKVLVQGQIPHEGSLLLFGLWYDPPLGSIKDIWGPSASEVFALGEYGAMLRYTGGAWVTDTTASWNLVDVWGTSASDVYAVGEGTIVHWNGTKWSKMGTGHLCMHFLGRSEKWSDWYACPELEAVWGSGPDDVWAVGDIEIGWYDTDGLPIMQYAGFTAHYDGNQWVADTVGGGFRGVWGSAANDVWAVGDYGSIFHYDGTAWRYVYNPWPTGQFSSVWGLSSTNVYAPHVGGVLHYDGVQWRPVPGLPVIPGPIYGNYAYRSVWGTAPDNLFVAYPGETNRGIKHWNGSTWTDMYPGSGVSALWGFGPNDVMALTASGIARGTR